MEFARRVLLVVLVVALALTVWKDSDIPLRAFRAVLVALGFDSLAVLLRPVTGGRLGIAVALAALAEIGVITAVVWVFGAQISSHLEEVSQRALEAARRVADEGEAGVNQAASVGLDDR
jgi:predicted PurR-regulated permease PerM